MHSTDQSDAFLAVIQANKGIIYKIANAYCKHAADRADLVQEMIIQLWRSFDSYTDRYKYSTWIYRIALNVAISFYRKEKRRKLVSGPPADSILHFADSGIAAEAEENIGFLQQFIAELKEVDRALLLLYLEEKSQKEIAEITGMSVSNVGTRINRIKKILKQKFSTIKT